MTLHTRFQRPFASARCAPLSEGDVANMPLKVKTPFHGWRFCQLTQISVACCKARTHVAEKLKGTPKKLGGSERACPRTSKSHRFRVQETVKVHQHA